MKNDTLTLARDGIFPILTDGAPAHGFGVAGTIQGEGIFAGVPSLFVRMHGCNLRCIWLNNKKITQTCDTAYTSLFPDGARQMTIDEICQTLQKNRGKINHVVITGGEPMLQNAALEQLTTRLKKDNWQITIETNGTIRPPNFDEIAKNIALLSISPKLTSSAPTPEKVAQLGIDFTEAMRHHAEIISDIEPLKKMVETASKHADYQLKFVLSSTDDEMQIKEVLKHLPKESENHVVLMPLGIDAKEMRQTAEMAVEVCIRNGWRYSPRLHIDIFGNKEGI